VAEYDLSFRRSALKELEGLPRQTGLRTYGVIEALTGEPRPPGCRKIQGAISLWRVRVSDDHLTVVIVAVRHRSPATRQRPAGGRPRW
jgi:mRNA interferase RelE/StbE